MGWKWSFGSSAARETIESQLAEAKKEPVFSTEGGTDVAAIALVGPVEPQESWEPALTLVPPTATLLKTPSVAPLPFEGKRAPKLGLRVQTAQNEMVVTPLPDPSVVSAAVSGDESEFVTGNPVMIGPADAPTAAVMLTAEPANESPAAALVVEPAIVEEIPPPPDYLATGRTLNTFGHAHRLPADDERQKEWAEQRVARGFDDTELWNLEDTIARFALPRLRALRAKPLTPPSGLTLGQWHILLEKMIVAFALLQPPGGGSWDRGKLTNAQRSQLQEGLDHFRHYFFALTC